MNKRTLHKFADMYRIASGLSSKPEQAGHGAPFLSFSAVFNNYFLLSQLTDLMDTNTSEQMTCSIREGDIFLTRTSEVVDELGMSSVSLKDYPGATYSGFLKRLRPIKEGLAYPKFMAFYLRSPLFRKTMTNNAVLTLRASLNEAIFSYFDLLLPDYEEQKRIGDLLHLLHERIELNNRINAELETMAKTLYDYWFVQFDFPDANGKPYKTSGGKMVYNSTLKREIPEGWEVKYIEEVAGIKAGGDKPRVFSHQKTDICSIPIFSNGIADEGLYGFTDEATINTPSLTISARGSIGYTVLRNKPFTPIIRLITVTPHASENCHYFYEFIKNSGFSKSGSVQQQLTVPLVSSLSVLYPPAHIMGKFTAATLPFTKKTEILKTQNLHLIQLRDWLLPMLMNGQVTVK